MAESVEAILKDLRRKNVRKRRARMLSAHHHPVPPAATKPRRGRPRKHKAIPDLEEVASRIEGERR